MRSAAAGAACSPCHLRGPSSSCVGLNCTYPGPRLVDQDMARRNVERVARFERRFPRRRAGRSPFPRARMPSAGIGGCRSGRPLKRPVNQLFGRQRDEASAVYPSPSAVWTWTTPWSSTRPVPSKASASLPPLSSTEATRARRSPQSGGARSRRRHRPPSLQRFNPARTRTRVSVRGPAPSAAGSCSSGSWP